MKQVRIPVELEQQICKDYLENIALKEIAQKHSINRATINNVRIRNDLPARKVVVTEKLKANVLELYIEVKNITEVKRRTKLDRTTISNILREHFSKEQLLTQQYINNTKVKENPFLNLEDDKTNYFLGLIAADGCVTDMGQLSLGLTDEYLIRKYVEFLKTDIKVHKYIDPRHPNAKPIFSTKFTNKEITTTLISYGITPRKSLTLNMNIDLNFSFLRGYIDGNGNIRQESKGSIALFISTASKFFKNQVQEFLHRQDIKTTVFKTLSTNEVRIGKKEQLLRLYDYLYSEATIYLERKRVKFDLIR